MQIFRTARSAVADVLRERIASGEIPAGEQLRQLDVAAELGVSSTPVREAFAALRREGLLIKDPQNRLVIFTPTIADVLETYAIRTRLETLATRHAVPALTEEDLSELEAVASALEVVEGSAFLEMNQVFHDRLYSRCGMPHLLQLIDDVRAASYAYITLLAAERDAQSAMRRAQHRAIVDRCYDRDVDGACAAMQTHLHATEVAIQELLARA